MSYYPPNSHPTTPGASYPYAAGYPQTGPGAYATSQTPAPYPYTSYGTWPYAGYSYYHPQQQHQAPVSAPKPATTPTTVTPAIAPPPVTAPAAAPATRTTPSTYTFTSYARDPNYGRSTRKGPSHRGLFTKELRNLMYGFGDDRNPANDTVNVMEEILIEYIIDICQTASAGGKKSRLSVEDLRRALSRTPDAKKLARMEELLFMQEDIKRARAQFPDMHPTGPGL